MPFPAYYDTLAGTVKGAWGLRKMVSTWTGALIRIRDTFDNSEHDVGFDVTGNLLFFPTVGDARIVKVYEQTGSGIFLGQATAANQPKLVWTAWGRPQIDFLGGNAWLWDISYTTSAPYMVATPCYYFLGGTRGAPTNAYATIFGIPHTGGADVSPYFRTGMAVDSTSNTNYTIRPPTSGSTFGIAAYNAAGRWVDSLCHTPNTGKIISGIVGQPSQGVGTGSVTYPIATGLVVGTGGGGGGGWNGWFTELAIVDDSAPVEATVQTFLRANRAYHLSKGDYDPYYSDVKLLIPAKEGAGNPWFDYSAVPKTPTISAAGVALDNSHFLHDGASLLTYGPNNPNIQFPDHADWDLSGTPFTLEFGFYTGSFPSGLMGIGQWGTTSGSRSWIAYFEAGAVGSQGKIAFYWQNGGTLTSLVAGSGSVVANTFHRCCVEYDGTKLRLYVDESLQTSVTTTLTIQNGSYPLAMGRDNSNQFSGIMWYQDVRYTKNRARYANDGGYLTSPEAFPESGPTASTVITSLSPTSGTTAGGTAVTITGSGLTGSTNVTFDGTNATSIVVVDDTHITCVTPAHAAGAVDVKVFNPAGDATATGAYTYVTPIATITNVSPNSGPLAGGTAVTITGTLFTGATDVKFDGVSATSIVVVDAAHITCDTPAGTAGPADVQVFTPAGNPIAAAAFTYRDIEVRVTDLPILVLDKSNQGVRLSYMPILVLYQEKQPNRVTEVPLLVLYEPKPVPLPKVIIPEVPLTESWNWLTVINTSYKGREQRARLRETPRYQLDMTALILNEQDRVDVYNMLMRYLKSTFLYPMFQYYVDVKIEALSGDTKIFADTTVTDLRAGEFVVVYDDDLEVISYLEIASVDADGVNLVEPLIHDVGAGWQICPSIKFMITPTVGLTMRSKDGDFSLTMESVEPRVFQRPGAAPTLTYVDGILVVPERPMNNDTINEDFDFNVTWYDNDTSIPDNLNEWSNPKVSSRAKYNFDRRVKMDYWRAVADYLKGRQNPALFPTFRNDLPLREPIALNATEFTTFNINFYKWWTELTFRYIMLETANGIKYRAVIDVQPHYDGNGDPDYVTVKLGVSVGNTTGDNVISSISYMNLFRLSSDSVKLEHSELDTVIEFPIKAVDK